MRVLLVEPYFGGSHRAWASGYQRSSAHEVEVISLPAKWWKWRMRGGFITLAERCDELEAGGYRPDRILATDMLDVAGFRGVLPASWRSVPIALYFHESQMTYPTSPQMDPDLSYAFTNWTSAVAADLVMFNSEYHRRVFFQELPKLLRHFPDHRHEHLMDRVLNKSIVIPVGVDLAWVDPGGHNDPPLVMWNHRWEHDKDPDSFVDAVIMLAEEGVRFRLALCGESFAKDNTSLARAGNQLGDVVVQYGHAPADVYRRLLNQTDVVVSTARQEFFGVAVVEAMAAGACPVLPDRLSYPELVPSQLHGDVLFEDDGLLTRLRAVLSDSHLRASVSGVLAPHVRRFGLEYVSPELDAALLGIGS